MSDLLLSNGTVYDGTGSPSRTADVLIGSDGTIKDVGRLSVSSDFPRLDCTGLAIAPGFVDVHSHCDVECLDHRKEKIFQGCTFLPNFLLESIELAFLDYLTPMYNSYLGT